MKLNSGSLIAFALLFGNGFLADAATKNENDEKCFKWAVTAALHHESNPELVSNIKRFINNYSWSGLKFPVAVSKSGKFQKNNEISVKVLSVNLMGKNLHIQRK